VKSNRERKLESEGAYTLQKGHETRVLEERAGRNCKHRYAAQLHERKEFKARRSTCIQANRKIREGKSHGQRGRGV